MNIDARLALATLLALVGPFDKKFYQGEEAETSCFARKPSLNQGPVSKFGFALYKSVQGRVQPTRIRRHQNR